MSKAIDKAAGATREVIGPDPWGATRKPNNQTGDAKKSQLSGGDLKAHPGITAPATPAAREWEGWGTALKPAFEPIVLARKPLSEGTVAANVLKWRTGALNIGASRVAHQSEADRASATPGGKVTAKSGALAGKVQHDGERSEFERPDTSGGRWPANVVHDGSDEVVGAFPSTGTAKPARSGIKGGENALFMSRGNGANATRVGTWPADEGGSAARFFYSAKASKADRNGSKHPTVKPIALMEWLATLITPPGGTVLDPFAGSGTTGIAATRKGFNAILCEKEAEYVADIVRRFVPQAWPWS